MAGTVNVDKLKNDAFSAIDALFTDEDSAAGSAAEHKDEGSPLGRLEEYILALDWECTSKDIREAIQIVDELLSSTEDKNILTLLKILKNILVYLSRAGSNAHPETLGIAGEVVSGLTRVSNTDDPQAGAKETRQLYERFKDLKQKISGYNQKLRKGASPAETQIGEKAPTPQAEPREKPASEQATPVSEPAPSSAAGKEPGTEFKEDIKLIKKEIKHLQERQTRLEELVHRMFSEADSPARDSNFASDPEKGLLSETAAEDTFDFVSGDIDLGSGEESSEEDISATEETVQEEGDRNLENVAYVQIFKIGPDLVALPSEHINNVFKLTGKTRKKINSETAIPLKDFSGLFKKLSGNMKGALRGISEKELKKITAEVRSIGAGIENPKNVILCTCDHGQILLPVTAPHSGNLFLVTEMQHEPNNYSQYSVQIESLGNIPVYIPC
jgi:hypothetical protein